MLFVFAAAAQAAMTGLSFRPLDADYSAGLDRIIMISAEPNQVHIYDPATGNDKAVNLPKAPANLSLSSDGLHAAVMQDALIAYINLSTATIEKLIPITASTGDVVLGNGYIYVVPTYEGNPISINLETSTAVSTSFFVYASGGKYNSYTNAIYDTRDGSSPNGIQRYNIANGVIAQQIDSPYHSDYPACGTIWFSPDQQRIYNSCTTVYRADPDPKADMTYVATLPGINAIQSLSTSEVRKLVAAVPANTQLNYPKPSQSDNQIVLFESDHLNVVGKFQTPDFAVGSSSYPSHIKWIFFNKDSSSLEVLLQADSSSNVRLNYALYKIQLENPDWCTATFSDPSAQAAGPGTLASVKVSAPADCTYNAVSNAPWIQVVSGGFGSGNSTLTYLVRPNQNSTARSGSIMLGNATFTINQDAALPYSAALTNLSFKPVAVDYSRSRDEIVMASSTPNELHIYDVGTANDTVVPLARAPLSLSVSPDGLRAAVGHDGWVSYVNLVSAQVESVYPIATDVSNVLLAANSYIYAFPQRDWSDIYAMKADNGAVTSVSAIYDGRIPRLDPSGDHFYLGGNWTSKWDISNGTPKLVSESFDSPLGCGNFWLSSVWGDAYTACGKVYNISEAPAEDLAYRGEFPQSAIVQWAASSPLHHSIAVINGNSWNETVEDTQLKIYGDDYLNLISQTPLPSFTVGGSQYSAHGKFAFWNASESRLIVISEADTKAGLSSDYGISVFSFPDRVSNCPATVDPTQINVSKNGGFETVTLTIANNCGWSAAGPSWVTIEGTNGDGPGQVLFNVTPNNSTDARTGTLQIAGQTITIQQEGEPAPSPTPAPAPNPQPAPPSVSSPVVNDFDGDGKSDAAVWRPENGTWYVLPSGQPHQFLLKQWGLPGDAPVAADYDHDGKTDFAVWRPANGTWYVIPSSAPDQPIIQQWGLSGDVPVPADFDHDGKVDFAVWRPTNGTWYVIPSSAPNQPIVQQWGLSGDVPVPADFDGDGKIDFAVWRPAEGNWYIIPSSAPNQPVVQQWGLPGDVPLH